MRIDYMPCFRPFFAGLLSGVLFSALLLTLGVCFLANLLVVTHEPTPADAIIVLGGDNDGSRLRTGLQLHSDKLAPYLILTAGSSKAWEQVANRLSPAVTLVGRGAIFLEGSTDTRTDAELSLHYCRTNNLHTVLVVTSPYHTLRAQFIFNDIAQNLNREKAEMRNEKDANNQRIEKTEARNNLDFELTVISSGDYGKLIPPDRRWWTDRRTLETVWLEFGKILYWELTPFMEFQGKGGKLKEGEKTR